MNKFLTGKQLEEAVYDIIWEAQDTLLIVSPYIKLDDYFKELFDKHKNNPEIHILLVFGKNEKDINKSLNKNDIDFFKSFPNVSIVYVPNLHAKYYGNERKGIITSINLYDYSFKNNIEFGIYSEHSFFSQFKKSADNDAWDACMKIAKTHGVVFIKRPVYEKKKMIINLGKSYVKSDVLFDSTDDVYGVTQTKLTNKKYLEDFPEELELSENNSNRPTRENIESQPHAKEKVNEMGFCIRTGVKIPFNIEKPLSAEAYRSWSKFSNSDYPEKYCHFSGEPSNGETSVNRPVLKKNWNKLKEVFQS